MNEEASQPPTLEPPQVTRRSKITTPLTPVAPEELGEELNSPPPPRRRSIDPPPVEVPVDPAELHPRPANPEEWVEPSFSEVPTGEELNDYPNEYDELLGKVFKRKDKPESRKRYEPLSGYWNHKFTEDKNGTQTATKIWVLEVLVFVYTKAFNPDKTKARRALAVVRQGDEGNSLIQPALFKIPAETFRQKFELDQ